ncbi:hypothetical protein DY000_02063011 [Brassica cretica]|uniref:DNA polymerase zeta catalytic subunit N-terminal domain-containing protein n=1 Tax=Brassica cretica TaxID=69181 RepID=A0ABQ7APC6_BRACR|nr:hypothetical protein DY000_02063011 [Brassica cretica]
MAESLPGPNVFSLRIVSIDYYMASPIPAYDLCYSSFQGGEVKEVPVIRVYVDGIIPAVSLDLEKALKCSLDVALKALTPMKGSTIDVSFNCDGQNSG